MVLWISAHFQTKQSPWTTQYHKEQMFWHLFLSHYMCWLGPHNNIIIMIRIWYLVRENDDHDEEGDCGSVCLVLANKTCSRTGLTSLSLRTRTLAPLSASLIINCAKLFDWSAMTNCFTGIAVWKTACCIVWGKCKMQQKYLWKQFERIIWAKIDWGVVWKLLETRLRGTALRKACHHLFPMNKIDSMTNVSRIKFRRISMGNF